MSPLAGNCWWHIVINTHGTWLTGDPRGFRSRHRRIESSGDYKKPPPVGEHAGLYRAVKAKSSPTVSIPADLYEKVGTAIVMKIQKQGKRLLAVAVDAHHAHVLIELADDREEVKQIVGRWKQHASHAVRERLPGKVWAKSCDPNRVMNRDHQVAVFHYILRHAEKGAWVWRFT